MGCDIHLVVERRVKDKWIAVNTMNSHQHIQYAKEERDWSMPAARSRNYMRFAALAGVRGEGPPPRGLPDDLSETARFLVEDYGVDGHSHSWLPLDEACKIFAATQLPPLSDHFAVYPASYFFEVESNSLADHRLIFWFDN